MKGNGPGRGFFLISLVLVLVAGGAITGGWFWIKGSVQKLAGSQRLAGLEEPVTVHFDRHAVPHIFADSEKEAFRVQGFLHASERLWQMELLRRTARGRLAELLGDPALGTDRLIRTLDLWGVAGRNLAALPDPERRLLEAYASGVNQAMERWSGPPPPEFLLLRTRPEPWDARTSLAIGALMALDLSSWRTELARFHAAQFLPPEKYAYYRLPYPAWGPTILESAPDDGRPEAPEPAPPGRERPERPVATAGPPSTSGGWNALEAPAGYALGASNSWAVASARARDGRALLANDMHLPLRAPSIWYLNALHARAEDLHVGGLSIPGIPGVVVGYNRGLAWSFTDGMVDDMDFVVEAVSLDRSRYRHGDGWLEFLVRPETLQVRGSRPVVHRVRETVRGPVVSDVLPDMGMVLSALWVGRERTAGLTGLLEMNRSTDVLAFDAAVRRFTSFQQNVIYATSGGRIGYRLSGTVPRREFDGSLPISFEASGDGWTDFLSPEELPALVDPSAGYLASANNLQARELFGVLGVDYPLPFRARRIVDRLEAEERWSAEGMRRLQLDTRSLMADRVLERAVAAAHRVSADTAAGLLAAWDRDVGVDSREALVFHAWLYRLRELVAADEFEGREGWAYFPDAALLRILEDGGGPWVDDVRTDTVETLEGLEERAMRDALLISDGRRWGEVNRERSVHALSAVPWLDRLFGFTVGSWPAPGTHHTVRAGDPRRWAPLDTRSWTPPFENEYGASARFVAELGPAGNLGRFLLPTGQSGNPFSRHYRDMAERWTSSELIPLPLHRDEARRRAARTLELLPD